jgi:tetratricopeptide (TPR) repeat protein
MLLIHRIFRPYLDLQRSDAMPLHAEGLYLQSTGRLGEISDSLGLLAMWMPLNYRANLLAALRSDSEAKHIVAPPSDWITLAKLSCYAELCHGTSRSTSVLGRYLHAKASQMLGDHSKPLPKRPFGRCSTVMQHVVVSNQIVEHIVAGRIVQAHHELSEERRRLEAATAHLPSWLVELLALRTVSLEGSWALKRGRRNEALRIWKKCIMDCRQISTTCVVEDWARREFCRRRIEHFVRNSSPGSEDAQELSQIACDIDPYDGRAWLLNANVQVNVSIELALEYYRRAAQLDPTLECVARTKAGIAHDLMGRSRFAAIENKRALDNEPTSNAPARALKAAQNVPPALTAWGAEPICSRQRWVLHAFRPFFDLGPRRAGPLLTYSPLLALSKWKTRTMHVPMMQRTLPPAFRQTLFEQAGLAGLPAATAVLPIPCGNPEWDLLADGVNRFGSHEPEEQLLLSQVLSSLAMYEAVVLLLNRHSNCRPRASAIEAELSYTFAFSEYMLFLGGTEFCGPSRFARIARNAPKASRAAFASNLKLLVYAGKNDANVSAVKRYSRSARSALDGIQRELDQFAAQIWESRYWRAASFEPFLVGAFADCFKQLEFSQSAGENADPTTERERIVRQENFIPILESTGRVAMKVNDLQFANELAQKRVDSDPDDALGHIDLGNSLFRLGRWESAALEYMTAASLGPPGTEIAWYLAGESFERLGDASAAADMYITSLSVDSGGIAPRIALRRLAQRHPSMSQFVSLIA